MDITNLMFSILVGAVAGWLVGSGMRGGGFGPLGNIVIGIIGGLAGGFSLRMLAINAGGLIGSILLGAAGAVLLLYAADVLKRPKKSLIDY